MRPAGIATALYGWMERYRRDGVPWDWDGMLTSCAAAGVDGIELDPTPDRCAILKRLDLPISAAYVGLQLHQPYSTLGLEDVLDPLARQLADAGAKHLLVNADPDASGSREPRTAEQAVQQGENLSRIAERVAPLGLRVSLHNHAANYHDAARELESVVEHADVEVGLCIDTGWALVAGHDPIAWAREHGDRVHYFHLRNQQGRTPTEDLEHGELDVPALLAQLPHYRGWLTLELWHPEPLEPERTMEENVRRSVDYLRSLTSSWP